MSEDKADEDKVVNLMLQKCREYPASSILAVSQQAIAKEKIKLPAVALADFSPATYTCAQHTEAKKGGAASANKADIAELWSIAFIQGFKNVEQKDMVIPMENKAVLTGAIANNCCSEMWLAAERAVAAIGWIPMSANAALSVNTPDSTNGQLPSAPVNLISNAPRAKAAITDTV